MHIDPSHRSVLSFLLAAPLIGAVPAFAVAQDFVVPAGTTLVHDTSDGRIIADSIRIEANATLRVIGARPLMLQSRGDLVVDGTIDLSGEDSRGVLTLNTTNLPEPGALGSAGAGEGGMGSFLTSASTPLGGSGFPGFGAILLGGGGGGESCFAAGGAAARRAAGGAGGVLGPDRPISSVPNDPQNIGLVAQPGWDGSAGGLGALQQATLPRGGALGQRAFVDSDPSNDFWGTKVTPSGATLRGELTRPLAGSGGGAGGDAIQSAVFPPPVFSVSGDEKGAGGGGGGGLGLIAARRVVVGVGGRIVADGGSGGGGENALFFDRIGGGSGGGSGGMLVIQAEVIDLSAAGPRALSARGGRGGQGANDLFEVEGAGGNGGPGIVQLHAPSAARVVLPPGVGLASLSVPEAHVLLPKLVLE